MNSLSFSQNELTGARITVPFTVLKKFGPKHHAIVIGINDDDGEIWIAELSRRHGYRLAALKRWLDDNRGFLDGLKIEPNSGPRTNAAVAQSAIEEVIASTAENNTTGYNVLFNNCETFANRQLSGKTTLSPQIKKAAKALGLVVAGGALVLERHLRKSKFR